MKPWTTEISKAENYISAGDRSAANDVLEDLFERFPEQEKIYSDAINVYVAGEMFHEARQVFDLYKTRFLKDLSADFTVQEISRLQNDYESAAKTYEKSDVKVFRRMSLWERGRASGLAFTGLSSLFPIKELRISPQQIFLRKGNCEYRFTWDEIEDAFITKRSGYKGGRFSEAFIKTLHIKTKDKRFAIDISMTYPDFKHNNLLLAELRKHIRLREE